MGDPVTLVKLIYWFFIHDTNPSRGGSLKQG